MGSRAFNSLVANVVQPAAVSRCADMVPDEWRVTTAKIESLERYFFDEHLDQEDWAITVRDGKRNWKNALEELLVKETIDQLANDHERLQEWAVEQIRGSMNSFAGPDGARNSIVIAAMVEDQGAYLKLTSSEQVALCRDVVFLGSVAAAERLNRVGHIYLSNRLTELSKVGNHAPGTVDIDLLMKLISEIEIERRYGCEDDLSVCVRKAHVLVNRGANRKLSEDDRASIAICGLETIKSTIHKYSMDNGLTRERNHLFNGCCEILNPLVGDMFVSPWIKAAGLCGVVSTHISMSNKADPNHITVKTVALPADDVHDPNSPSSGVISLPHLASCRRSLNLPTDNNSRIFVRFPIRSFIAEIRPSNSACVARIEPFLNSSATLVKCSVRSLVIAKRLFTAS